MIAVQLVSDLAGTFETEAPFFRPCSQYTHVLTISVVFRTGVVAVWLCQLMKRLDGDRLLLTIYYVNDEIF